MHGGRARRHAPTITRAGARSGKVLTYMCRFGLCATLWKASASNAEHNRPRGRLISMAELFEESLINRDPRWPVLLRLTGASLAVHIATLAILLYVPGVRDAFNIAAMLANAGYVDKPYDRTVINEDVRLLALADKFRYPPGYFATDLPVAPPPPAPFPAMSFNRGNAESTPIPTPEPSPEPSLSLLPSPHRKLHHPPLHRRRRARPTPQLKVPLQLTQRRRRLSSSSTRSLLRIALPGLMKTRSIRGR